MKKISLGFSPCPNDAFIFDALVHRKIDTGNYYFELFIEDVEALNHRALKNELDVTKLSFAAFAECSINYLLSSSGSALGHACGPLLITNTKRPTPLDPKLRIGIPGFHTTANLLLSIAYPELQNKVALLFSDIESALLEERIDLGLIIHENRFTYQDKGLSLIKDLGDYWEQSTGQSIPLGGIALNRRLNKAVQLDIQRLIKKSIEYAFAHPESSTAWTKSMSQELDDAVIKSHISLYVNQFSFDLGIKGKESVDFFLAKAQEVKFIEKIIQPIFL